MVLFCETCNVGVSSEVSMRDHIRGRRHLQAVAAAERRKNVARCSIYCRDFPPMTTQETLCQYFSQFGTITRVMLEPQRGCYCIVNFDNEASVHRALSHPDHNLLGWRLTVRPRKPITTVGTHNHHETRSNLHKVKSVIYEEAEAVKRIEHEQLMQKLLQASCELDQMEILYESTRLSDADLQRREEMCQHLHSILFPFFPTCTIHQFGSSVNGFGMYGCDMDIFLDFHDDEISLEAEQELQRKLKPVELPYISDITSITTSIGPLMPSHLRKVSLIDRVRLLSRVLTYQSHGCADVTTIPSARCPIARFVHLPTGIKCDLSINNRLALRNTQLLRLYAEDRRVRLLVFAVRYWGKLRQVAGNFGSGPRLSNYCLSLLVTFYLANTHPPVLPTVLQMARMADEQCIIEGWNCSLPSTVPASFNTQSADELLHGFFQFFSGIDLSSNVFLMRSATTFPVQQLLAVRENNAELKDFKIRTLAVQDPFVLGHNIALNVNGQTKELLVHEIHVAANKTTTWKPANGTGSAANSSSSAPGWGLPYLFSSFGCQLSWDDSSSPGNASLHLNKAKEMSCLLLLDESAVSPRVLANMYATGNYRCAWYKITCRLLLRTLRDIFLFSLKTETGCDVFTDELDHTEILDLKQDTEGYENKIDEKYHDSPQSCSGGSDLLDRIPRLNAGSERTTPEECDIHAQQQPQQVAPKAGVPFQSGETTVHPDIDFSLQHTQTNLPFSFENHSLPPLSQGSPRSSDCQTSPRSEVTHLKHSLGYKIKRRQGKETGTVFAGKKRVKNDRRGHSSFKCENGEPPPFLSPQTTTGHSFVLNSENSSDMVSAFQMPSCPSRINETVKAFEREYTLRPNSAYSSSACVPMMFHSLNHPPTTVDPSLSRPSFLAPVHTEVNSMEVSLSRETDNQDFGANVKHFEQISRNENNGKMSCPKITFKPIQSHIIVDEHAQSTHKGAMGEATCIAPSSKCVATQEVISIDFAQIGNGEGCSANKMCTLVKNEMLEPSILDNGTITQNVGAKDCASKSPLQTTFSCSTVGQTPDTLDHHTSTCGSLSSRNKSIMFQPLRLVCEGQYRTWYGRKVLWTNALVDGHCDDFNLEILISQQILNRDSGLNQDPLKFLCSVTQVSHLDRMGAEVAFESLTSLKEFSVFVTFFKSFFPKLLAKELAA